MPALRWVRSLFIGLKVNGDSLGVGRWFPLEVRLHEATRIVRCDASPYGFGGILIDKGVPIQWWSDEVTSNDMEVMKVARDPAWQAEFELLAILISIRILGSSS